MNYSVSVIVPVYNTAPYLRQCLDSILNQTKKDIQLIVVDDGSTDGCGEIIDEYAKKHPGITAIHQRNQGMDCARITGYQAATGKYIGWVDADDYVKPEMYETLYRLAEKENADLVYCNYESYPHKVAAKAQWFREYKGVRNWEFIDKNTQVWGKLYARELLQRVRIMELVEKYKVDSAYIVPMLEAEKIGFTREKLYVYRVGHLSMSGGGFYGSDKIRHYLNCARIAKQTKEMLRGKPYEAELSEYFDYRYIYALILLMIVAAKNAEKEIYFRTKDELLKMNYLRNPYTYKAASRSYGPLKAFVMTRVIPANYQLARLIVNLVL